MHFANPYYLYLLLLLIPLTAYYILKKRKEQATLKISTTRAFADMPKTYKHYLLHAPFVLRVLALAALIIIIARPQGSHSRQDDSIEGIDIVMSLDISSSMLAQDLHPNRLEAFKKVAAEFVRERLNDNIGLVVFSGESFTQCPLTTDHEALVSLLENVQCGMIEDGTAIGNGLAIATARLKDSKAKSKVIILLTDGSNNRGKIAPLYAAEVAKTFGVRVYTIGVGGRGEAIDEQTLQQIAVATGGSYFRAMDNKKLEAIYNEIDQMEKTKFNASEYRKKSEEFILFALLLLVFLLSEMILRNSVLKQIP
jgi:Ca-activated chloride channel family protein